MSIEQDIYDVKIFRGNTLSDLFLTLSQYFKGWPELPISIIYGKEPSIKYEKDTEDFYVIVSYLSINSENY